MSPQPTACSTTTGKPASKSSAIGSLQLLEIVERFVNRAYRDAGHASLVVELAKQHQVVEVRRGFQRLFEAVAQLAGAVVVRVHVMRDEEARSICNQTVEGLQGRLDVGRRVQSFAHVVQERTHPELLVLSPTSPRQLD